MAAAALIALGSAQWANMAGGGSETDVRVADQRTPTTWAPDESPPIGHLPEGRDKPAKQRVRPPGGVGTGASAEQPTALQCRHGANGGATDVGVHSDHIHILQMEGNTSVIGSLVERAAPFCGRLAVVTRATAWPYGPDANGTEYFAILASPGLGSLDERIKAGIVDQDRVPIVGATGLTMAHSQSPWVWPVGTPLARQARIAVQEAYEAGARTFAVVHDATDESQEAVVAFDAYVRTLPGASVRAQANFRNAGLGTDFNAACADNACDAMVLAIDYEEWREWRDARPPPARLRTAGLSTMLNENVPSGCHSVLAVDGCGNLFIWTPFTPPIPDFEDDPEVQAYGAAFRDLDPTTAGSYIAARRLMEILRIMGPNVTRARLRQLLDQTELRGGLVDLLAWRPGDHVGNVSARAIAVDGNSLVDAGTGWKRDPLAR